MHKTTQLVGAHSQLDELPRRRSSLLPALFGEYQTHGYISDDALVKIAAHVRSTPNEVEGVISGYPEFRRVQPKPHVIRVCTGTSCMCAGGQALFRELQHAQKERAYSDVDIERVPCLFACAVAPVIEIDGVCLGRADVNTPSVMLASSDAGEKR